MSTSTDPMFPPSFDRLSDRLSDRVSDRARAPGMPPPGHTVPPLAGRLVAALDSIREGVQIIDFDWRYVFVNEALCRHDRHSRHELLGRTMMDIYPGIAATDVFRVLDHCMTKREPREFENDVTYPDGSTASFELRIQPSPEGIFVLSLETTDRKRLEAQLRQAQKMDAVGKLAGGVAHDFNNLLTGITSFTHFALHTLPETHRAADDLREVLEAADRAAALTRQLLAFARRQTIDPKVIDVNGLVSSIEKLLRRLLGEDIDIVTRPAADLWPTLIDPGAFEQVLVNLAVNARDAMPDGGRLTIETSNVHVDEGHRLRRGGVIPAGEYMVLAVSDDGIGMDASVQEKIFEPFFTTKGVGKGTGLGLATCYGIVRQAGGHIWVYSEPGQGSTFKIYLPRSDGEVRPLAASAVDRDVLGHETVIIVEDDARVRQVALRSLSPLGYVLLIATNAEEAMAVCERHAGAVDLLLTDIVMPGANGRELATRLSARYPKMRTLYISGYTEAAILHRGVLTPGTQMLAKPFSPHVLADRVREVLDSPIAA
jgi:two-component system cell cycle sensor histidine kinase/response regulator CckA